MKRTAARSAPLILLLGGTLLLAACAPFRSKPSAPTAVPSAPSARELDAIPDAVPRAEPRSKYGNPQTYEVFGKRYRVMDSARGHIERGTASWYGPGFHSERTSSGEPYDMYAMTAAHKTLPIPSYVRVTHLGNQRSVVVRVNDRGPFVGDRIIDLSYTAAAKLEMIGTGTAPVEIRVLEPGESTRDTRRTAGNVATDGPSAGETRDESRVWRANRIPSPPRVAAAATATLSTAAASAATATAAAVVEGATTALGAVTLNARFLQTGAFSSRANAQAMVERLAGAGIRNAQVREAQIGDRPLFRVHVGPVEDAIEADDMIERLRLAGVPDARAAHE